MRSAPWSSTIATLLAIGGHAAFSTRMTVMVDPLRRYAHVPFAVKDWCHMAVDGSFEELHAFAAALGIPRSRFQGDHYDLVPWIRERAVALGALEVSDARAAAAHGRPARRPRPPPRSIRAADDDRDDAGRLGDRGQRHAREPAVGRGRVGVGVGLPVAGKERLVRTPPSRTAPSLTRGSRAKTLYAS